jgi:SAM-dependent methyltransferase
MILMTRVRRAVGDFLLGVVPSLDPHALAGSRAFPARMSRLGALQSPAEWQGAVAAARTLGLPPHHDPPKTWDTLKCVWHVLQGGRNDLPVLDAGSGARSAVLAMLRRAGYRQLHACDVRAVRSWRYRVWGVHFSRQDLTRTDYPDAHFQAVTAVSVIEHGVPLPGFLREMARILAPGGLLLVSTDFWPEPIDCTGIYPYGPSMGEMKIFQRTELEAFCAQAARLGLDISEAPDWTAPEKVVRWERVDRDYTFAFLAFRKCVAGRSEPAGANRRHA